MLDPTVHAVPVPENPARRYSQQEIAAIFEEAAERQKLSQRARLPGDGLSLAELQQIGAEAGLSPEFIAQAAASIDVSSGIRPRLRYFGLPVGVERVVDLPRPLSDLEWDRLVVDLRETFQAQGEIRREGSIRRWTNGNLSASLEPGETASRLRLRTVKGSAQPRMWGSMALLVVGLAFLLSLGLADTLDPARLTVLTLFVIGGLGSLGFAAFDLPRWARERERQMEAIAGRALQLAGASMPTSQEGASEPPQVDLDALDETPARAGLSRQRSRSRN